MGLTPAELLHHPSSYSQFVTGPEIVAAVYEIKLPQVKVNGSDTGSDFRKESLRLLRHPAVETEFMLVLAFSWAVLNCTSINITSTGDARGGNGGPESSRASGLNMQADRVYSHGLPGGGVCVQTGSAGIAERPNLNPE